MDNTNEKTRVTKDFLDWRDTYLEDKPLEWAFMALWEIGGVFMMVFTLLLFIVYGFNETVMLNLLFTGLSEVAYNYNSIRIVNSYLIYRIHINPETGEVQDGYVVKDVQVDEYGEDDDVFEENDTDE